MSYTITIDDDSAEDIVRGVLLNSLQTIEKVGNFEDVGVWDAINEVLAYFSTPKQMKDLETRMIPEDWVDIVLQYDKEKPDAYHLYTGG